jgi:HAD superfamily hydrolase (TIGR01490 family)
VALAIFDLDETLISADSDHEWGEFMARKGLVDAKLHKQKNDAFYEDYKEGRLDIKEYLAFACSALTPYSMRELHQYRREFMETVMSALILEQGRALVEKHKAAGDYPMVITSTIEFVTAPIVEELGIKTLIAPIPEIKDERYTGNIVGTPSFAAGKVTRLKEWLGTNEHKLDGSYFYSDSHNDLPLLKLVDNPVAVNPDDKLRILAIENNWQIISLRDDV